MRRLVPEFILAQQRAGTASGAFNGAALFIDISGFTALTETLSAHGPSGAEAVADALRFYFDPLVSAVHACGGWVSRYAGDAFTALFDDPLSAAAAGAAARDFFASRPTLTTPYGDFDFGVKVGVSGGSVRWGVVPVAGERGLRFHVRGSAVDGAAAMEHKAERGQVVLSEGVARALGAASTLPIEGAALLTGPIPAPPPARRPPSAGGAERFIPDAVMAAPALGEFRYVACVFAAFDSQPDPGPLVQTIERLARRYGGTFNGLDFGDKGCNALVLFGAPTAHEDDVERALDFAAALRASRPELRRRMRAGVTYGPVYAGFYGGDERLEFSCLGRAVNLSARLMVAAPRGAIFCGPEVTDRAARSWRLQPEGARPFKGFDEPLAVHALRGRQIAHTNHIVSRRGVVGRRPALSAMSRAAERARRSGVGGVIWLDGELGSGKSYLLDHWRTLKAGASWRWLSAPCEPVLRESFNPFTEALRRRFAGAAKVANRVALDSALEALTVARPGSSEARELQRTRSALAALLGLERAGDPYQSLAAPERRADILEAITAWVSAESLQGPVALHLEDAQWADPDSAEALRRLSRLVSQRPVLLVISARPSEDGAPTRLAVHSDASQSTVTLGPLEDEALKALAERRLGAPVDDEMLGLVRERSAGNPLFATQILDFVRARGPSAALSGALPDDVHALLIARLDALEGPLKRAVQAASVLGQTFAADILACVLGAEGGLADGALEEVERQTIWRALDDGRYRFRHALTRDAAYTMQSQAARRSLHRAAAEAILQAHGRALTPHQSTLGHHWEQAGEPHLARTHYLKAARAAAGRCALADAERLLSAVLSLAPADDVVAIEARGLLGRAVLMPQGRTEEAAAQHSAALATAEALGDTQRADRCRGDYRLTAASRS